MVIKRYQNGNSAVLHRARDTARKVYWNEYERESHACAGCESTNVPLEVHHRDGDCLNNHLINLIAVCPRCHYLHHKSETTVDSVQQMKRDAELLGGAQ